MGDNNNGLNSNKVVTSFGWKLTERIVSQGINLLVQIILARLLVPEVFGSLAIIIAITNFATIIAQSGFSTYIVQKKDLKDDDVSTTIVVSLFFSIIFYIIIFFLSPTISSIYNDGSLVWPLRVLGLIIFLNSIYSIQTALLSREMKFKQILLRSLLAIPVSGAIGIILAYKGFGLWALVIHHLSNMFITVIVLEISAKKHYKLKFSKSSFKTIYSFSGKVLIGSIISEIHDSLRSLVIGKKYSTDELAYYDKGYTYASYFSEIIRSSLTSVLLPAFSRLQDNCDKIKRATRTSLSITAFVMFPCLCGIALVSEDLIHILLTDKWLPAVPFLILFCILRIPYIIKSIELQAYYALGRSDVTLVYGAISCLINIIVLFICLKMGTISIAIGVTIVEFLCMFATWIISSKLFGYSFFEHFEDVFKTIIGVLVMVLIVNRLNDINANRYLLLSLKVFIGASVYIFVSFVFQNPSLFKIVSIIKSVLRRKKLDVRT